MFTGSYFHTMDNKGRVSIPARYREILKGGKDHQIIITNFGGYVLAFPQSEWNKIEAKFAEQPLFRKDVRDFQRFLISGVEECILDRQGRILVSPNLRNYARLSREVSWWGPSAALKFGTAPLSSLTAKSWKKPLMNECCTNYSSNYRPQSGA